MKTFGFSLFFFLLFALTNFQQGEGANILFYMGFGSLSHRTAIEPLAHSLAEVGHNITIFGPMEPTRPNPKFTEYCPKPLKELYDLAFQTLEDRMFMPRLMDKYFVIGPSPLILEEFGILSCASVFQSPESDLAHFLNSTQFDLVFVEHSVNQCGYALGYYYKAPVILFSPTGFFTHEEEIFGTPIETSWLPSFALPNQFTRERTFYDKLYMTWYTFYSKIYTEWVHLPKIDKIVREGLKMPEMPSLQELDKKVSLFFTNQYFANDFAKSLPPFVVQLGGMHCNYWQRAQTGFKDNYTKLPQEMEEFISKDDDVFIYVSFGTIISMSKAPDFLVQHFFEAVKDLKVKFFWKWDKNPPENLPKNVFTAKWFPQQDLLDHPKIRGFVSHGGLMSTQQSVCSGVPMISVPVVFDQPYNAQTVDLHEMGFHLELSELTAQTFKHALEAILYEPKYARNAKKVQERFLNRPMSPLDLGVFWTNYVLKEGGDTAHLKSLGINQSWWERRLLDVWLFILTSFLLITFLLYKMLYFIVKFTICRLKSKDGKIKAKESNKLKSH